MLVQKLGNKNNHERISEEEDETQQFKNTQNKIQNHPKNSKLNKRLICYTFVVILLISSLLIVFIKIKLINIDKRDNRININNITTQKYLAALEFRKLKDTPNDEVIRLKEYNYYEAKYNISQYKELPFCVVMTSYNNNANDRLKNSLNSVFNQNYSNYHLVYIDDFSTDGTKEAVEEYIRSRPQVKNKIQLIPNNRNRGLNYNYILAAKNYCKPEQVFAIVDGDDELIGRQSLKVSNAVMQKTKAYFVYSNLILSDQTVGPSKFFPQQIIDNNDYRKFTFSSGHLQTFYTKLILLVDQKNFKDQNGDWFKSAGDVVMSIPLLELSHRRIQYIPELLYYYNAGTGLNDHTIRLSVQFGVDQFIRKYPKLKPLDRLFDKNPYQNIGFQLDPNIRVLQNNNNNYMEQKLYGKKNQIKFGYNDEIIIKNKLRSLKIIRQIKHNQEQKMTIKNYNIENYQLSNAIEFRKLKDTPNDEVIRLKEYNYYEAKYNISQYKELPFCVVMTSYNNNANDRLKNSLNSVFNQNYSNYHLVYIDDFSTDGTKEAVEEYIRSRPQVKNKIQLIPNNRNRGLNYNYILAAKNYCKPEQVFAIVDGDDELIGRQSLKVSNAVMQKTKAYFVYSNLIFSTGYLGFSQPFTQQIMDNNNYRYYKFVSGHLQAFYTKLLLLVDEKNFKDFNGDWFKSAGDVVMSLPLLQLSHPRIQYIPQVSYYYNSNTGLNDQTIREITQKAVDYYVRSYPKLQPINQLFYQNPYNDIGFNLD